MHVYMFYYTYTRIDARASGVSNFIIGIFRNKLNLLKKSKNNTHICYTNRERKLGKVNVTLEWEI